MPHVETPTPQDSSREELLPPLSSAPPVRDREHGRLRQMFPARGELPSLATVRSSRLVRLIAVVLMVGLFATLLLMLFAPWQQTVKGSGSVINYDPAIRPQMVESPVSGRVVRLGDGIREMVDVKKGQLIAELADLDPDRIRRLEAQLENLAQSTRLAEEAVAAAKRELSQSEQAVEFYRTNVETRRAVRRETIAAADAYIDVARQGLVAARKTLEDKRAILAQAEPDYLRQKQLFEEGLASELKYQIAKQKLASANAAVDRAAADVEAAEVDISAKERERETKAESTQSAVESAEATLRNAEGKVESAKAGVSRAEQALRSTANAETEARSKLRRQENQQVFAPIDGILTNIYADGGSSVLAQGDPVARVVPLSEDRVVEIYLDGNDAPLVEAGRHVRLQFEGWPAIQFAGWPSVAVGTFGGEVISVDASDSGAGKFRVLVKEVNGLDPESGLMEQPWPHGRFLKPGVRSQAWVLLETVPLWWEVWRNLNGFPPVVDTEGQAQLPKAPKLPKP